MKRSTWCSVLLASAAGCPFASEAAAACQPIPAPLIVATPALQADVDRFNALVAADPYLLTDKTAERWQALADDLKRNREAPTELVARSELMLAGALNGAAAAERGLAFAQAAFALAEAKSITSGSLHAALLTMLAAKEVAAGKTAQAVVHADAALLETDRADGKDSWAYGNAALTASSAHEANGDYIHAEPLSGTAERLAASCLPPDTALIGATIASHGSDLELLGRFDEALGEQERAVTWNLTHLPESDPAVASTTADLGYTLHLVWRRREAEALLRRALDLYVRYHPEDIAARAVTTSRLAGVLTAENKNREAEQLYLAAIDLYARANDRSNPLAGSGPLRRLADVQQQQGRVDEALTLRRRAVALMESRVQPRHPELARAKIELASTLVLAGRAQEALKVAEPAITVLRAVSPPGDPRRIVAEIVYARVTAAAGGDAGKAFASAAPAAARAEAMLLASATSPGDLTRLAPGFASSFAIVARLALAAHEDEAAFHALQLANMSEVAIVGADVAARRMAADPAARALVEQLEARTRDHQQLDRDRLAANANGDTTKALTVAAAIRQNDDEAAQTTRELERVFPSYRALSRPRPVPLAAVRARLKADEVVLAPLMLPGETLVLALTRDGLTWTTAAATRAEVTALITRTRAAIDASRQDPGTPFDTAAARSLGAIVLPPALATILGAHRHIVYYASGALATVPPALLVTKPASRGASPAWLIRSHSISIATTLAPPADAGRAPRAGFLGVGAPALAGQPLTMAMRGLSVQAGEFGKTNAAPLPQLPDTARELRAMAATFPASQRRLLIGSVATKPALEALPLDRYGVIAFATHGLVTDALPGLTQPALVLTPAAGSGSGSANDGLLTAGEIAGMHLDADWVILSACDTAGGSDSQTGSYSGLASAFIQAGARALLVSHWPVRDDAAARITVATLAAAQRGLERPEALRQAMLALMRERRVAGSANPAIWAPFVLVEQ